MIFSWKAVVLSIVSIIFVYHLIVASHIKELVENCDPNYNINIITNLVTMKHKDIPNSSMGFIITRKFGIPIIEKTFNDKARQLFDIYTMIIPYRVVI